MPVTDPRIDAYIAGTADFARPILQRLRLWVHKACPDVTETIKWGMPYFESNGAILCWMAAFSQHAVFGIRAADLLRDPTGILQRKERTAMGHLGRLRNLNDLPPARAVQACIAEAASLNEIK